MYRLNYLHYTFLQPVLTFVRAIRPLFVCAKINIKKTQNKFIMVHNIKKFQQLRIGHQRKRCTSSSRKKYGLNAGVTLRRITAAGLHFDFR